ncbi:hypothetical protein AB0C10_18650 [Microbispora amethystogenes]|uniref:hypothetical protein n=1 Tax=Microbispora amethystogenes TaxID=1427754 RepID=UPI0033D1E962
MCGAIHFLSSARLGVLQRHAVNSEQSPSGAADNNAISDDGDAGMTHFGSDQQGVGTSMIF